MESLPTWVKVTGAIVLPQIGGIAGAFITRPQIQGWYKDLKKPDWRPPNWLFGPMWTSLYTGMGYASYLIWRDGGGLTSGSRAILPLGLYGVNLALNWAWTPIYFGKHKLGLAMIDLAGLWGTVAGCIVTFYPINKVAAGLMVPYLGWLTIASALNYRTWQDNPNPDSIEPKKD